MDDLGKGLEQAQPRFGLHAADHLDHGAAGHQAVGIENDQEIVDRARTADEIGDVAGLLARVCVTAAVEDRTVRYLGTESFDPPLLVRRDCRIRRVGEHREIEHVAKPGTGQVAGHRRDMGKGLCGVFVVDRHENCGPGRGNVTRRPVSLARRDQPVECDRSAPAKPARAQCKQAGAEIVEPVFAISQKNVGRQNSRHRGDRQAEKQRNDSSRSDHGFGSPARAWPSSPISMPARAAGTCEARPATAGAREPVPAWPSELPAVPNYA